MRVLQYIFIILGILILSGCKHDSNNANVVNNDSLTSRHVVLSDDSVIVATWWDTGDGGTAPDIESECQFKSEKGNIITEKRPLLQISHPERYCAHHEIEKIVTYESPVSGQKTYLFFLYAKEGSFVFSENIVALQIEGDSLVKSDLFDIDNSSPSSITIKQKQIIF